MEMNTIVSERKIETVLERFIPSSVDSHNQAGYNALIHRENPKRWIKPHTVSKVGGSRITIQNENSGETKYNSHQIKPFVSDLSDPSKFFAQTPSPFKSNTIKNAPIENIYATKVIHSSDPRSENFEEAKRKKVQGSSRQRSLERGYERWSAQKCNNIGERTVLAIKDSGTSREVWKARFAVQGYRDNMKTFLVYDSANVGPHFVKILVGLAAVAALRFFSWCYPSLLTERWQTYEGFLHQTIEEVRTFPEPFVKIVETIIRCSG